MAGKRKSRPKNSKNASNKNNKQVSKPQPSAQPHCLSFTRRAHTQAPKSATPAPADHNPDESVIEIHSDASEQIEANTPQPNSNRKRPAVGSAGSPAKRRTELDGDSHNCVQYQLILVATLDNGHSRSGQKVVSTGSDAYKWLEEREGRFIYQFKNESDLSIFFHSREAVISGVTKTGKVDKS